MNRLTSQLLFGVAIVGFATLPLWVNRVDPMKFSGGYSVSDEERSRRNAGAFARILGEVRVNLSDLMFIKSELYLHGGVAYTAHTNLDETARSGKNVNKPDQSESTKKGASVVSTIIREGQEDFRGWIGHLEREVKPFVEGNVHAEHTSGDELLPWYRLMTLSNPHNVRAYQIGAWFLKDKGDRQVTLAMEFIEEGIENNPDAFQLHLTKGYMLMRKIDDPVAALVSFRRAAQLASEAKFVLDKSWTDYQETDARASMRMAVMMEQDHGSPAQALILAKQYLKILEYDFLLIKRIEEMESESSRTKE